ncbi:RNA polymerase sigma factor [Chitinophaga sp. HK235]|uniref:RNA polymerase sigma factor n=1 Tax=Chitinophaga sp. HK235 TaxID=2952571 RepID=UPI001BA9A4CF|nr:RNA polymerase sigma factor [Chitinophaga sp. HK235]
MLFDRKHKEEDYYLQQAIQGNRKGFEYLVTTYKDLAYTIARNIVLNKEDAEEVVQDAFVKAFSALGNFRKAAKFSTWLYRIVYNTALTKGHARKAVTIPVDDGAWWPTETVSTGSLTQADRKRYIDLALRQLTEDERVVITLYYLGEKDITEIAAILALKKSAVKMRLLRGRKSMKAALELLLPKEVKDLL